MLSKYERASRVWLRQHNICTNFDDLFEHHLHAEKAGLPPSNSFRKCMSHVRQLETTSLSIEGDKDDSPRQLSESSSNSEDLRADWEEFKNGKAI